MDIRMDILEAAVMASVRRIHRGHQQKAEESRLHQHLSILQEQELRLQQQQNMPQNFP